MKTPSCTNIPFKGLWLALIVFLLLGLFGCSDGMSVSPNRNTETLDGTRWVRDYDEGRWQWNFGRGTFEAGRVGAVLFDGAWRTDGKNVLIITDEACGDYEGVYLYSVIGFELHIGGINDGCGPRKSQIPGVWRRAATVDALLPTGAETSKEGTGQ